MRRLADLKHRSRLKMPGRQSVEWQPWIATVVAGSQFQSFLPGAQLFVTGHRTGLRDSP